MSSIPYPEPPWHMHGFSVLCPFAVRAADVEVPRPLDVVRAAGRCLGLIAYVEYREPSPLVYSELIWMPTFVRFRAESGKKTTGQFVARIYVDSEVSMTGGRELWALPKTLARFERTGDRVEVRAEDGTELSLELGAFGPRLPVKNRIATLQPVDDGVVRFRGDFESRVRIGRAKVTRFRSTHPGWKSFEGAQRLGLASCLDPFDATMQPPVTLKA